MRPCAPQSQPSAPQSQSCDSLRPSSSLRMPLAFCADAAPAAGTQGCELPCCGPFVRPLSWACRQTLGDDVKTANSCVCAA